MTIPLYQLGGLLLALQFEYAIPQATSNGNSPASSLSGLRLRPRDCTNDFTDKYFKCLASATDGKSKLDCDDDRAVEAVRNCQVDRRLCLVALYPEGQLLPDVLLKAKAI